MRLGIFGGTFDPPHVGHLLAASDAIEHLRLDPARARPGGDTAAQGWSDTAPPQHRLAMVRLTAGDDPRLEVDSVEVDRDGLSYTVDTLREFARRFPSAERFLSGWSGRAVDLRAVARSARPFSSSRRWRWCDAQIPMARRHEYG